MNYRDQLIEEIKKIDSDKISDNISPSESLKILEPQRVYIWIRLYLKEEIQDIKEGDNFLMKYSHSGESLLSKFICFGKKNLVKDHENQILNYDPEDNKKVLCLMIDENEIKSRNDIPFIRTLFKTSPYYEYQLLKREDLTFMNVRTLSILDYIDCDF